jgi:hypothetical protein
VFLPWTPSALKQSENGRGQPCFLICVGSFLFFQNKVVSMIFPPMVGMYEIGKRNVKIEDCGTKS